MGSNEEAEDDSAEEPSSTSDAPPPKKKRAKKKKRRKKRSTDDADDADDARPKKKRRAKKKKKRPEADGDGKQDEGDAEKPKRRIPWLAIILTIAAVELFLFGSRGRMEICVAKEDVHDFDLVGTPRTDENTARYPSCETRMNIGMKSDYDDLKTDAVVHACRRANMFRGKEAILTCAVEADGWQHRVQAEFVPPWDPDYRKRLFWFLD